MFDRTARVQRDFHSWSGVDKRSTDSSSELSWKRCARYHEPLGKFRPRAFLFFFYERSRLEGQWKIGSKPWKDTALYLHSRYNGLIISTSDIQNWNMWYHGHQRRTLTCRMAGYRLLFTIDGSSPNGQNSAEQIARSDPKCEWIRDEKGWRCHSPFQIWPGITGWVHVDLLKQPIRRWAAGPLTAPERNCHGSETFGSKLRIETLSIIHPPLHWANTTVENMAT